jgi:CheY-like chemotaxis protein
MEDMNAMAPIPAGRPESLCLLLVEDDDADAFLVRRAANSIGSIREVVRARDGVEAQRLVQSGAVRPDLAFVDLHMPLMGGLELMEAFSAGKAGAFPSVVLTSSTAMSVAVSDRLNGVARVVVKPDTLAELIAVLRSAVETVCADRVAFGAYPRRQFVFRDVASR